MFGLLGGKHIVNAYNLNVVIFVALGTLSTAYGLAIIGSTVGQPDCEAIPVLSSPWREVLIFFSLRLLQSCSSGEAGICAYNGEGEIRCQSFLTRTDCRHRTRSAVSMV